MAPRGCGIRGKWPAFAAAVVLLAAAAPPRDAPEGGEKENDDGSFSISTPVACKEVKGFADYVKLPGAALTCHEKLVVYFEPRHYKSARTGHSYEARFTQEGRIRRLGEAAVLWSKPKILDYKVSSSSHPQPIYLMNKLSLKALKPGEYEYDIILRDAVGKSKAVVRSLPFTIKEPKPGTSVTMDESEDLPTKEGQAESDDDPDLP